MFFKGSPPALKETNRSPKAICMEVNNNHACKETIIMNARKQSYIEGNNNHAWKKTIIMYRRKQSCMEGNNNHV